MAVTAAWYCSNAAARFASAAGGRWPARVRGAGDPEGLFEALPALTEGFATGILGFLVGRWILRLSSRSHCLGERVFAMRYTVPKTQGQEGGSERRADAA